MPTLANECLVVPVACSARRLSRQCSSRADASPWFVVSEVPAELAKELCPREKIFEHEHQTDSDVRLGWFQDKGLVALMPKPTRRVWSEISLPNSSPLTGSSTHVRSGNGGGENCIAVSATAHAESSPQSNWWSARTLQCNL